MDSKSWVHSLYTERYSNVISGGKCQTICCWWCVTSSKWILCLKMLMQKTMFDHILEQLIILGGNRNASDYLLGIYFNLLGINEQFRGGILFRIKKTHQFLKDVTVKLSVIMKLHHMMVTMTMFYASLPLSSL